MLSFKDVLLAWGRSGRKDRSASVLSLNLVRFLASECSVGKHTPRSMERELMLENERVRKYPRVGLGVDSAIWSEVWQGQIGDAHPVGGVVTVLGAGGAFVEVNEEYIVGDEVGLRFVWPGTHDEVACKCVVRDYLPGRGIGVEFTDILAIDREHVRALVLKQSQATS